MDLGKFIDEFVACKDTAAKGRLVKKHVIVDYLPFAKKIDEARRIIKNSLYTEDGDFYLSSPAYYMLFTMSVIQNYTDLEFDTANATGQFDLVEKYGLMDFIAKHIGDDYERFSTVLKMMYDDEFTNHRSLTAFLDQKIEVLRAAIEAMATETEVGQTEK